MNAAYVYIIGSSKNPVKIGWSIDPEARVRMLQSGSPDRIVIHHTVRIPNGLAAKVEGECHKALSKQHRLGEWFNIDADDALSAVKAAAQRVQLDSSSRLRKRGDLVSVLAAAYEISPWAPDAVSHYRTIANDPARKLEIERINQHIAVAAGAGALVLFQKYGLERTSLAVAFCREPWNQRDAEAELSKAVNALSEYYSVAREQKLLDEIHRSMA